MQGEISASDLAEFDFCSVAWYLDKEGYRKSHIASVTMANGRTMHKRVSVMHRRAGRSVMLGIAGFGVVAVLLFLSLMGYL